MDILLKVWYVGIPKKGTPGCMVSETVVSFLDNSTPSPRMLLSLGPSRKRSFHYGKPPIHKTVMDQRETLEISNRMQLYSIKLEFCHHSFYTCRLRERLREYP